MARDESAPVPEIIELLETLLEDAKCGDLRDIVCLARYCGDLYADSFHVGGDVGDMVLELRSTVIRLQTFKEQVELLTSH